MIGIFMPVFLISAIAFHLPIALWWQRRMLHGVDEPTRRAVAESLHSRWVRFCIAYGLAFAGVLAWLGLDWSAIVSGQRNGIVVGVALTVFHGVWWPFLAPIIQGLEQALRKQGVLTSGVPSSTVRVATLTPRRVRDYLPRWSTPVEVALLAVSAIVLGTRYLMVDNPEPRVAVGAGIFTLTGLVIVLAYGFWIRMETQQSYAMLSETATEEEIDAHRRFRVRLVYAGQLIMAATFFAAAGLIIEVAHGTITEAMAGGIGGTLGALVGLAGGTAGTIASLRAAKLQRSRPYREP